MSGSRETSRTHGGDGAADGAAADADGMVADGRDGAADGAAADADGMVADGVAVADNCADADGMVADGAADGAAPAGAEKAREEVVIEAVCVR